MILGMALGKPPENVPKERKENFFMIMPLVILIVVLFLTGVFVPEGLYHFIDEASMLLGGG